MDENDINNLGVSPMNGDIGLWGTDLSMPQSLFGTTVTPLPPTAPPSTTVPPDDLQMLSDPQPQQQQSQQLQSQDEEINETTAEPMDQQQQISSPAVAQQPQPQQQQQQQHSEGLQCAGCGMQGKDPRQFVNTQRTSSSNCIDVLIPLPFPSSPFLCFTCYQRNCRFGQLANTLDAASLPHYCYESDGSKMNDGDGRPWERLSVVQRFGRQYPRVRCAAHNRVYYPQRIATEVLGYDGVIDDAEQFYWLFPEMLLVDQNRHPRDWQKLVEFGFIPPNCPRVVLMTLYSMKHVTACLELQRASFWSNQIGVIGQARVDLIKSMSKSEVANDNRFDEVNQQSPPPQTAPPAQQQQPKTPTKQTEEVVQQQQTPPSQQTTMVSKETMHPPMTSHHIPTVGGQFKPKSLMHSSLMAFVLPQQQQQQKVPPTTTPPSQQTATIQSSPRNTPIPTQTYSQQQQQQQQQQQVQHSPVTQYLPPKAAASPIKPPVPLYKQVKSESSISLGSSTASFGTPLVTPMTDYTTTPQQQQQTCEIIDEQGLYKELGAMRERIHELRALALIVHQEMQSLVASPPTSMQPQPQQSVMMVPQQQQQQPQPQQQQMIPLVQQYQQAVAAAVAAGQRGMNASPMFTPQQLQQQQAAQNQFLVAYSAPQQQMQQPQQQQQLQYPPSPAGYQVVHQQLTQRAMPMMMYAQPQPQQLPPQQQQQSYSWRMAAANAYPYMSQQQQQPMAPQQPQQMSMIPGQPMSQLQFAATTPSWVTGNQPLMQQQGTPAQQLSQQQINNIRSTQPQRIIR